MHRKIFYLFKISNNKDSLNINRIGEIFKIQMLNFIARGINN